MTDATLAWGADDLPLLGEPAPVELANSLYGEGDERVDFLATPGLARLWLAHAGLAVPFPARPAGDDVDRLRALRDAVRHLVDRAVDGAAPSPPAVAVLNRAASAAPLAAQLVPAAGAAAAGAGPSVRGVSTARAHDAVVLLGGPDRDRLRRCAAPDCTMAFLQQHRRRRWCHDSCGHRVRQAAYHRRRPNGPGGTGTVGAGGTSGSARP